MTNQLKLRINQDYNGGYTCTNDNYDGAPDAGYQPQGDGLTPLAAIIDYLENNEHDENVDYIISGKDLT